MTSTFFMTVTGTDGTVTEGACSDADVRRSLSTAARRGYRVEVAPNGGTTIVREIPGKGSHAVAYKPLPAVEHRTRTTEPSGYQYGADGTRRTNARGGLMRDRSSYWVCSCGQVGAGATRVEARWSARRHRENTTAGAAASMSARLAMLARDHKPEPWAHILTPGQLAEFCQLINGKAA